MMIRRQMGPRTIALVPLNALGEAKSRLRETLADEARVALVGWLARRVITALLDVAAVDVIAVVSPEANILALIGQESGETPGARPRVLPVLATGGGLNEDLEQGRLWALDRGAQRLLVVLGDLPLFSEDAVRRMFTLLEQFDDGSRPSLVLAPDRAGHGTNALLLSPADVLPFAFGERSFARHLALARQARLDTCTFVSQLTRFDVDMPEDVEELVARGLWTPDPTPHQNPSPRRGG